MSNFKKNIEMMNKSILVGALLSFSALNLFSQSPISLNCNSHSISDEFRAYDTIECSLNFHVFDSQNRPLNGLAVVVEYSSKEIKESKTPIKPNLIKLETDSNGFCDTGMFHGTEPLKIKLIGKDVKYKFEFSKRLDGYGYDIFVKLCD